jgi:hypothetical protein
MVRFLRDHSLFLHSSVMESLMRSDLRRNLEHAYGDWSVPNYAFAAQRLHAGMHAPVLTTLGNHFATENCTSLGSDDVCISIVVRPRSGVLNEEWLVKISLVGMYAIVSSMASPQREWPITRAEPGSDEANLLNLLTSAGIELLSYDVLAEPVLIRPPNSHPAEVYTVYNALFSDMVPFSPTKPDILA